MAPKKPNRKPSKRTVKARKGYDGGMSPAPPLPPAPGDPEPMPPLPFAPCPRCGRLVHVVVPLNNELWPHRTPMPEAKLCDYPVRVHASKVTREAPPAGG